MHAFFTWNSFIRRSQGLEAKELIIIVLRSKKLIIIVVTFGS